MSTIGDVGSSAITTVANGAATTADVASIPTGTLATVSKAAGEFMSKLGIATGNTKLMNAGAEEISKSEMAEKFDFSVKMIELNRAKDQMNSFFSLIKSISEKV